MRALTIALVLFLSPAIALASTQASELLDRTSRDIDSLSEQAQELESSFLDGASHSRARTMASRYLEGEALFYLDDWDAAAVLLVGPVEDPSFRSDSRWAQARWMLAESFYKMRNYALAKGYFVDILSDQGAYSDDAVHRLLDIAIETRRFDGLAELLQDLSERSRQNISDELRVTTGKALYFQGNPRAAARMFGRVAPDSEHRPSALYWQGVALSRTGELSAAEASFNELIEILSEARTRNELLDLGYLGLARIQYETQRFQEALDSYQSVPASSPHFPRALFERAWAQAQEGNLDGATISLERLALLARQTNLGPESNLVRGELLVEQERFEEALAAFELLDDRYSHIDRSIRRFMEDLRAADDPLQALLDPEQGATRMPEEVRPWLESDRSVMGYLRLFDRAAELEKDLLESREIVALLHAALDDGSSFSFNPTLELGVSRAYELRNSLATIFSGLLELEASMILPSLSEAEQAFYNDLSSERRALEADFATIPQTEDAMVGREAEVLDSLQRLETTLHEVELERVQQQELAAELGVFLEARRREPGLSVEEIDALIAEAISIERSLRELEGHARTIRSAIRQARSGIGVGDSVHSAEQDVSTMYRQALAAEASWLSQRRTSQDSAIFSRIDAERVRLMAADTHIATFLVGATAFATRERRELRALVSAEEANLARLEASVSEMNSDAGLVVARAAIEALSRVEDDFREVLLRANLGILDIAWRQYELTAAQIRQIQSSRSRDRRQLESDFIEILGGE